MPGAFKPAGKRAGGQPAHCGRPAADHGDCLSSRRASAAHRGRKPIRRCGEGKGRRFSLLQAEGRRCRPSIRPSHRGALRRGKHVYLSGRCIPRKGHAPGIKAESGAGLNVKVKFLM